MALSGIDSFLSPASWEDVAARPDGWSITWLIEVDSREREVVLSAECECGHVFGEQAFDHPEATFEAAEELTCPENHEED